MPALFESVYYSFNSSQESDSVLGGHMDAPSTLRHIAASVLTDSLRISAPMLSSIHRMLIQASITRACCYIPQRG
jgi:hypothetical protein